ncbi:MAG TPA: dimethyl sulfone monooxygenase SfnG, partial [Balneolaceae bacterium]|nr:dimethyl sulfone monooxygenase SfnG [Balneolaceae bacterium]
ALAANTEKLHLIGAVHPGQWNPGPIANFMATADRISNGRFHLNVVSGWFRDEYTRFGEPWLEHDERYERSEEFIKVLKGLWTEETFSFNGRFYQIDKAPLEPKPVTPPAIFQGGNSPRALKMAARVSDWLFLNGGSLERLKKQIRQVRSYAKEFGTQPPKIGVNAFVIARDTEKEAKQELENIIGNATEEAVEGFKEQVKQAGRSAPEGEGMWADSDFNDLIQYNDGFKTGLIGTNEQIVERIRQLDAIGVDLVLAGFLHFTDELPKFGREIIPAVKQAKSLKRSEVLVA